MAAAVDVHPLVIISACDHSTRVRMGGTRMPSTFPIVGLLLGIPEDSHSTLSIVDCVDVNVNETVGGFAIDLEDLTRKVKLNVEVFPTWKLVGWYTFGAEIRHHHMVAHQLIASQCDTACAPVFLRFEESVPSKTSETVPITCYRAENIDGETALVEASYRVASSEAENMAIEALMNAAPTGNKSLLEIQYEKHSNALEILVRKIEAIEATLRRISEVGEDHSARCKLLRLAGGITSALQALPSQSSREDATLQMQLDMLTMTLASITKTGTSLRVVGDAFSSVHVDRHPMK